MKIAIASSFKANTGGNFIEQLVLFGKKLEEENNSLIYIFPPLASERVWCKELIKAGNKILFIENNMNILNGLLILNKIIKENSIDCIYTHFGMLDIPSALMCFKYSRFKHIIVARSESKEPNNMLGFLIQKIKHKIVFSKTYVISVGDSIYYEYIRHGFNKKRIKTIRNGVSLERLQRGKDRNVMRSEYNFTEEDKIFLMMGYNIWIKGVDIACEAFLKLHGSPNRTSKNSLAIVVASNFEKIYEYIVSNFGCVPDWIVFLPPTENIGEYFRFSDYFISASRTEGFSNSLAEALLMKLPVIVSDIEGTMWALQNCYVNKFKSSDANELFLNIKNANDREVESLEKNSSYIQNNFNIQKWVDDVIYYVKNNGLL